MREERNLPELVRFLLKHIDERLSDDFAFFLGIDHALKAAEKNLLRRHDLQVHLEMPAERFIDPFHLVQTEQTVIHKNTGQFFPDGFVNEPGGDGRIHAARQPEHHTVIADLLADLLDAFVDEGPRRPAFLAAAHFGEEILEDPGTEFGVRDFGVELNRVDLPLFIPHRGERRVLGACETFKTLREAIQLVTVAHPAGYRFRNTFKERAFASGNMELREPVLAFF